MTSRYRQIAAVLAEEYASLPAGTKVAGEHTIAARFGVGRAAARAALQELARQMLVRRIRGGGTFTSRRVDYLISPDRAPSWSRTVREAGSVPRAVVRSCERVAAPAAVTDLLELAGGSDCFALRRRSFTDGLPASYGTEWVPVDLVPELPTAIRLMESLDQVLRQAASVTPERAWSRASMGVADDELALELECEHGDAAWFVESLNRDAATGRLLCLTERWIRADAVRVVFETGHVTAAGDPP